MKKLLVAATLVMGLTGGVAIASPASATGNYVYVCVSQNGSSYTMKAGEKLTNCKGSFLQKYLDGSKQKTVRLAYGGGSAKKLTPQQECVLAIAGNVMLLVSPPTGALQWAFVSIYNGWAVAHTCVGF